MQPYINVRDVAKEYEGFQGGKPLTAIRSINLNFGEGSFTSLVGPSGCGKSTLLQIIAGLMPASRGEIQFESKSIDGPPKGMLYLFQQYTKSLFPWRTILQNVAFGPENEKQSQSKKDLRAECCRYIELVGLKGFEDYYPWQLSGGMQQRVAIARALVFKPKVLLMDEPFSAVDALTRVELQDQLLRLWKQFGLTIIFVTHDFEEAIYLSQEVVVLKRSPGEIIEQLNIDLPYPRHQLTTRESSSYLGLRHHLHELIFSLAS